MIKVIVFDADGTLYKVNKERATKELFKFLEENVKIDANELKECWERLKEELLASSEAKNPEKRRREYLLRKLLEYFNIPKKEIEQLVREALDLFWHIIIEDLEPKEGVMEIIENLKENFKLVIASEEFTKPLSNKLNKIFGDWKKYFEFLITPETTGEMKPSEKFYIIVKQRLNVLPNEVLVVGDSWERDLLPAKNLGMKTALVNEERSGNPDIWVKKLKELKVHLLNT